MNGIAPPAIRIVEWVRTWLRQFILACFGFTLSGLLIGLIASWFDPRQRGEEALFVGGMFGFFGAAIGYPSYRFLRWVFGRQSY